MGQPVSEGDITCLGVWKRLAPQLTWVEYCEKLSDNPNYKSEVEKAREALLFEQQQAEDEGRVLPLFIPGSEVGEVAEHGHEIYTKAGLMSELEIIKHTQKTPKDLGLTPFVSEWCGPNTTVSFFLLSLDGMPPEVAAGLKKIKLYQKTAVHQNKLWLTPSTQLSKSQPSSVLDHLSKKYQDKRPTGLINPSQLTTLDALKELASLVESSRLEILQSDGQTAADAFEEAQGPVVASAALLEGLGDTEEKSKKTRRQKKGQGQSASAAGGAAAMTPAPAAIADQDKDKEQEDDASQHPSSKVSKKTTKFNAELALMDDEMKKVAVLHTSGKTTSSAKSLQDLKPVNFMTSASAHSKGHAILGVSWLFCYCCLVQQIQSNKTIY